MDVIGEVGMTVRAAPRPLATFDLSSFSRNLQHLDALTTRTMAPSSCMLAYDLRSLLRSAFLTTVGPSSIPTGSSSLRASFSSYSLRSPTFLAGSSFPTSLRFSSQQRTTLPSRRSFHVSPARSAFVLDSSHHDQVVQILKAKIEDRAELVKQVRPSPER